MIIFLRIFSIFIRYLLSDSNLIKRLMNLLNYDQLKSTVEGFKENCFLNAEFGNADITGFQYHSTIILRLFHFLLENQLLSFLFFALVDIMVAKSLNTLLMVNNQEDHNQSKDVIRTKSSQIKHHWMEMLYLFNPLTIINCLSKNFDGIYSMFLLLSLSHSRNIILGPFFFSFTLIVCSSNFFTCLSTLIYIFFFTNLISNRFKFFINFSVFLTAIYSISIFLTGFSQSGMEHHLNYYYYIKDSLPNLSMVWYLVSESFMRYVPYVRKMMILYQILANISIITLIIGIPYNNNVSLLFTMQFAVNYFLDRYGSYNDMVILLILLSMHYEILKYSKHFEISIMLLIEVFVLVTCRGYTYYHKNIGSSNHLFFQNFAFAIGILINILINVLAIKTYYKENIVKDVIDSIIDDATKKLK